MSYCFKQRTRDNCSTRSPIELEEAIFRHMDRMSVPSVALCANDGRLGRREPSFEVPAVGFIILIVLSLSLCLFT